MYHAIYVPASNKNKNEVLEYTLLLIDKMTNKLKCFFFILEGSNLDYVCHSIMFNELL